MKPVILTDEQRQRVEKVLCFDIDCCADKPEFVFQFWMLLGDIGYDDDVPDEVVQAGRELFGESDASFAEPLRGYLQSLLSADLCRREDARGKRS